ncbi:MAG: sugar ABC transporter ATP-binding protein [Bacillota bacterium]
MPDFILELKGIVKTFPGVKALNGVNLQVRPGEVHALLGENGAGKSTLIKVITGIYQPDRGEIKMSGKPIKFSDPLQAQHCGIAAIYQEPTAFPDLNVMENVYMGHYPVDPVFKRIDWGRMRKETAELLKSLEMDIDPAARMKSLSVAERQLVEIAKALSFQSRILIMDEPTAALTLQEVKELFKIINRLQETGTAIIYISHRLEETFEIADRVTVLRDGQYIDTCNVSDVTMEKLIQMMVGRALNDLFPKAEVKRGERILEVKNLAKNGEFSGISFELHKGEIVGLAGLVGAGRTELARTIFGVEQSDGGEIWVAGKKVTIRKPDDALRNGIAYLTEDRQQYGLVLPMALTQNVTLPTLKKFAVWGRLNRRKEEQTTAEYVKLLDIRAAGLYQKALQLSGGNQQKLVLAKWLATRPVVLILDEPTKGVDVGAKVAIYSIISQLAKEGLAILMISSELPEILGMSDRILVMHEGRLTAHFRRAEATQEKILASAAGRGGHSGGVPVFPPIPDCSNGG